ncbi:MAG: cell division protein ZipA [Pseudomonadales bacterium]|nr:cell division protein ZipA [Pseudomonadales bacterium]
MGLRELLILILILAIVAVSLRGLYVALKARRGQLRIQLEKNIPQYDPDELLMSELPNGGARLVERSFAAVVKQNSELSARDRVRYSKNKGDSAIPVLMDTVDEEDDTHEEEEVSVPRQSSVASAREAARQKHLQAQAQRPIDHLAAHAARPEPDEEQEPAEDYHDFYEDPLDASPLSVDNDPLEEPEEQDYEDDDDELVEDEAEDFDDSDDFDDSGYEDEEDFDDDEDFEDDEALDEDFNEPADDVHAQDYVDPDDFDDDDEEYEDEPEPYADEPDDEAWSDDEDLDSWEDENDAEDEEPDYEELAEEFDDVYGDQGTDDDDDAPAGERDALLDSYDDPDDAWDDEAEPEQQPVSAPRRWLKWAGEKLSGMSASHEEPVREREFHSHERSEPQISLDALDEESEPAPAPARKPKPAVRAAEPARRSREPLDRSRQARLFDDEHDAQDEIAAEPVAQAQEKPAAREPLARHKGRSQEPEETTVKGASGQEYSEVLVINVMAKPEREFAGVDLLPALLGLGLRFGDMNIFHRHVDQKADSPVLFSVANMVNPGTFDLNMINDFATRGVCFFMTLPNVANSMQAFERMLDAAQQLRMSLDGELKDDIRSVMTAQTIEHYRQRVRDFDLRQLRQHK